MMLKNSRFLLQNIFVGNCYKMLKNLIFTLFLIQYY